MADEWAPATLAAQALGRVEPGTGALVPGIAPATTFLRDPDGGYRSGHSYARPENPTFRHAEELLTALEGGADSMLFASGMAAATAVFQALEPGDHVLVPKVMYWGLRAWVLDHCVRWGLAIEPIDMDDLGSVEAALRPGQTRLVWLETPANPMWQITDIAAVAELAHRAGARMAVDSTVATPILTRPLALGADLVMHSATKYLNGHSDVIAGTLTTARDDEWWARLKSVRHKQGGILGSFEAWLLLRGMRTLDLRVRHCSRTAQTLAERLRALPQLREVLYPGLPDFPGHSLAARQMSGGFGGMLSIRVRGGEAAAVATAARVRLWKRATSLGGVESLIEHRASIEGPGTPVPGDLLRLSVGIEDPADLIADLETALAD
ncbi:MAG: PLP-dependent aspartate aminotransferase family protein [Geminicoccaceae bacterium]